MEIYKTVIKISNALFCGFVINSRFLGKFPGKNVIVWLILFKSK